MSQSTSGTSHLDGAALEEWERLGPTLHRKGVLTAADRAAFAAYRQSWAHRVEAEERLKVLPAMVRTPNGHVQESAWLAVAYKQLELMGRFAAEFGLTPSARSRLKLLSVEDEGLPKVVKFTFGTSHADDPDDNDYKEH